MTVLVAYEESQHITAALRALGVEAYSNDVVETRGNPEWHIQGDAMDVIFSRRWDAIITHKVCRFLANSGIKHLYVDGKKENGINHKRWAKMRQEADEFRYVYDHAPTDIYIAENPKMHPYALGLVGIPSSFDFQPWEHGHKSMKETHIWCRGIEPLEPTDIVGPPPKDAEEKKLWAAVHRCPPGPERERIRSETPLPVAAALAQWVAKQL